MVLIRTARTRLVIGAGYLGKRVAEAWRDAGDRVVITTRQVAKAQAWQAEGWDTRVLDVTQPDTLAELPQVDTVLYAVGFDRSAGSSRQAVSIDGFAQVLERLPQVTRSLIYISSTGVYGQQQGEWVNEETVVAPRREGGRACWEAEQKLVAGRWADKAIRLRLAGIYGPLRIPFLAELRAGKPLPIDPNGYLNLIYVDDAVSAVLATERLTPPQLLVISDGQPVRRGDFYREVARRLGVEAKFGEPVEQGGRAERSEGSKRVCNRAMQQALGIEWCCPSYREGIAAALGVNGG